MPLLHSLFFLDHFRHSSQNIVRFKPFHAVNGNIEGFQNIMRAIYLFGQTVVHLGPPGFIFVVSDVPESRLRQVVSGGDIVRLQLADDFDKQSGEAVKALPSARLWAK